MPHEDRDHHNDNEKNTETVEHFGMGGSMNPMQSCDCCGCGELFGNSSTSSFSCCSLSILLIILLSSLILSFAMVTKDSGMLPLSPVI